MDVLKINNLFSSEDFDKLVSNFQDTPENNHNFSVSEDLGRFQFSVSDINHNIYSKLLDIANSLVDFQCGFSGANGCEYNLKYGNPRLPTHFDGDYNDLIINYQLESNTRWSIGVDYNLYQLEDNSAIIFHPNENVHWRPRKKFKDGEFVRMIFFRFHNIKNISDYSYLANYSPHHEIFAEINKLRDSVSESN